MQVVQQGGQTRLVTPAGGAGGQGIVVTQLTAPGGKPGKSIDRVPPRTGKPEKMKGIFQSGKSQGFLNRLKVRENQTKYMKTQGI